MKAFIALACIIFSVSQTTFGQIQLPRSPKWTAVSEENGVLFSYKYADCIIPSEGLREEMVYLKFNNSNKTPVKIEWYNHAYYDGKCMNCENLGRDALKTIVVAPGEGIEGQCKVGLNQGLRIHSKWLQLKGHPELTNLEITDLKITPQVAK